jgi:hypothetical protein
MVDDEDALSVQGADPHSLVQADGEELRPGQRARLEVTEIQVPVREL